MPIIPDFLERLFGSNYKTTFYGLISKLGMVGAILIMKPDYLNFLSPTLTDWLVPTCLFIYLLSGFKGNQSAVDKQEVKPQALKPNENQTN